MDPWMWWMEYLCLGQRLNSSGDEQGRTDPRVLKEFLQIQGFLYHQDTFSAGLVSGV